MIWGNLVEKKYKFIRDTIRGAILWVWLKAEDKCILSCYRVRVDQEGGNFNKKKRKYSSKDYACQAKYKKEN